MRSAPSLTVKTPFGSAYLFSRRKVYQPSRLRPLKSVIVFFGAIAYWRGPYASFSSDLAAATSRSPDPRAARDVTTS